MEFSPSKTIPSNDLGPSLKMNLVLGKGKKGPIWNCFGKEKREINLFFLFLCCGGVLFSKGTKSNSRITED